MAGLVPGCTKLPVVRIPSNLSIQDSRSMPRESIAWNPIDQNPVEVVLIVGLVLETTTAPVSMPPAVSIRIRWPLPTTHATSAIPSGRPMIAGLVFGAMGNPVSRGMRSLPTVHR